MKKQLKKFLWINLGVMGLALSFSFFLSANGLVTGGIGGLAINILEIIERVSGNTFGYDHYNLYNSLIILGINVILLILAYFLIGKSFFFKTLYCSVAYPIFTFIFGKVYELIKFDELLPVAEDIYSIHGVGSVLIVILFSSLLSGVSIGLAIKHGASTGGVDIIEQINLKYFHIPYSITLFAVDGVIVLIAAILAGSFYPILYGIIYIFLSGSLIDSVVFGGFKSYNVSIITNNIDIIKPVILINIRRGLTVIDAIGGYTNENRKMIICVMTSAEVNKMRGIIKELDEEAFMFVTRTSEVNGIGFTKERDN